MNRILVGLIAGVAAFVMLSPAVALATFGIEPGKVTIDNLHPGAEADVPITIYNQNDYATTFMIGARSPDYTETSYEPFPYLEWISVQPEQITIDANEAAEVLAIIIMPEDAQYSGKKAEVWISFKEEAKPGEMIQVEIASRLLINTRVEDVATTTPSPSTAPTPLGSPPQTTAPATSTNPSPATSPQSSEGAIVTTIEGSGQIGISAGGNRDTEGGDQFPWTIVAPLLGVAVVLGTTILLLWVRGRT